MAGTTTGMLTMAEATHDVNKILVLLADEKEPPIKQSLLAYLMGGWVL